MMAMDDEELRIVKIIIFYPKSEESVNRQITFVSCRFQLQEFIYLYIILHVNVYVTIIMNNFALSP